MTTSAERQSSGRGTILSRCTTPDDSPVFHASQTAGDSAMGVGTLISHAPRKILIVDAEAGVRSALCDVLRSPTQQCDSCENGAEAYIKMRRDRFDVVLSNARLSEIDGFQLLDLAASMDSRPAFVLMSRRRSPDSVRTAFKRGAFDFLSQPLDMFDLECVIQNALRSKAQADGDAERAIPAPTASQKVQRDPETGLMTRADFCDALERLRARSQSERKRFSVIVFNAQCGAESRHDPARQDSLSRRFINLIRNSEVGKDAAIRLDPSRVMVAFYDAPEPIAIDAAERIRRGVKRFDLSPAFQPGTVRLAIGVAESAFEGMDSTENLVERALAALQRANDLGGATTVAYSEIAHRDPSRRQITTATVDNLANWIRTSRQQLRKSYLESTLALVAAVEAKEPFTQAHSEIVARYCEELARRLGFAPEDIASVKTAGLLHDIGKIGIPDDILRKTGPLDAHEFDIIKRHPQTAVEILRHSSHVQSELPYILHHHERYDGSGYPVGLAGEEIPLPARIINVCDAIDAMLSQRAYKERRDVNFAIAELQRCSGSQFDPRIAEVAIQWLKTEPEWFAT